MLRGLARNLALIVILAAALAVPACKTVQPQSEPTTTQAPDFGSGAGKAERVDDAGGFGDKTPDVDTIETGSRDADEANARRLLKAVYYDFDSADLRDDGRDTLTQNAANIKKYPALAVRIEGHCDERGTVEYNLALGDRRARAAREALVSMGISGNKLRTISYGKERPADPGHTEAAWAMNRRAEFVFIAE
ncbi:MAG TPA: peptidoglycan-associated lipoprotein Pal [Candidatus Polarisedimenticolia bacterium]|nr:peptidoglycan-associated lipoprotein Pal [Candidatus Polarisedimenticolia bacterium]